MRGLTVRDSHLSSLLPRVFLEIPDPKAQLAPLGRKGKRGTVRTERQASLDSPEPRVSRACGDLVETWAPRVTGA